MVLRHSSCDQDGDLQMQDEDNQSHLVQGMEVQRVLDLDSLHGFLSARRLCLVQFREKALEVYFGCLYT